MSPAVIVPLKPGHHPVAPLSSVLTRVHRPCHRPFRDVVKLTDIHLPDILVVEEAGKMADKRILGMIPVSGALVVQFLCLALRPPLKGMGFRSYRVKSCGSDRFHNY